MLNENHSFHELNPSPNPPFFSSVCQSNFHSIVAPEQSGIAAARQTGAAASSNAAGKHPAPCAGQPMGPKEAGSRLLGI